MPLLPVKDVGEAIRDAELWRVSYEEPPDADTNQTCDDGDNNQDFGKNSLAPLTVNATVSVPK